jgi:XRE family aerobic/anaerobic benzoate catabolism transcriptional regulator
MLTSKRVAPRTTRKGKASLHESERNGAQYLISLGQQIRALRALRGMTRKMLAADSGVSERFLADVESGSGNVSVLLLHRLANALNAPVDLLITQAPQQGAEFLHAVEFLHSLNSDQLRETELWLTKRFRRHNANDRATRIALLGLRGAGKSTIGTLLARQLDCPFVELDRLIEQASGMPLATMFDMYGQAGYRRFERRCLDQLLGRNRRFVLATGGSVVSEPATFQRLRECCFTVWLRANPEDYMRRVLAQGDTRPMANNPEAMSDLRRILREREPLYSKADLTIDTSKTGKPRLLVKSIVSRLNGRPVAPSA